MQEEAEDKLRTFQTQHHEANTRVLELEAGVWMWM
jgi:hypothetical protein